MELLEGMGAFWDVLSYIITVIIGGVGLKFYQTYLSNKQKEEQVQVSYTDQAISNLEKQVSNFASMVNSQQTRISHLEETIAKNNEAMIDMTKKQVRAEAKVEVLQSKIKYLENLLQFYTDKPISTISDPHDEEINLPNDKKD